MSKEEKAIQTQAPMIQRPIIHDDDFESEDFAYGWLRICAANSEVLTDPSKKIPGMEAGAFFNTMSQKVYGGSVEVIPLKFFRSYSAHEPGENGAFIRAIQPEEFKAGNWVRVGRGYAMPDGNQCREQFNYMVLLPNDPEAGILRLALGPGSFSGSKSWNTLIQGKGTAKHTQIWKLVSIYNPAPDKTKSAFYAIGKGSAFGGQYIGQISEADQDTVISMVETLAAMSDRLHSAPAPVEQTADTETL
jgi:hypothetical protein